MNAQAQKVLSLLLIAFFIIPGCVKKSTPPPMPLTANPMPAAGATPLEMERYQLQEEKRALSEKYGDNIGRIQEINVRLIQINIDLQRQANPHY